ncbi:MAG: class I SAM-dependent methyltransferase [Nitrospirota bacterium]|nr:class I SAM-dependent methyltransferase [Nitrospirota bacterium]
MERCLEKEIMDGEEQVRAYVQANFSKENQWFVEQFLDTFPEFREGLILDLGCGPADIPIRLVRLCTGFNIVGVDASAPMITLAQKAIHEANCSEQIRIVCQRIQNVVLEERADAIISNSLVHHVPNPLQFWYALKQLAKPGAPVLVMDLLRPESAEEAQALVDHYAADEPEQLRLDFYNSLLAAFSEDEVAAHLAEMNLSRLLIDVPDDRHWIVTGHAY